MRNKEASGYVSNPRTMWLGASDFTRLPIQPGVPTWIRSIAIARHWCVSGFFPARSSVQGSSVQGVYVSRKLRAAPIHVIDLLAITGNLERWKLDGVPVHILPQLLEALPA